MVGPPPAGSRNSYQNKRNIESAVVIWLISETRAEAVLLMLLTC